jgi:hypothetical protein
MTLAEEVLSLIEREFDPMEWNEKIGDELRKRGWKQKSWSHPFTHDEFPGHSIDVRGSHIVHKTPDGKEHVPGRELEYIEKLHKKD